MNSQEVPNELLQGLTPPVVLLLTVALHLPELNGTCRLIDRVQIDRETLDLALNEDRVVVIVNDHSFAPLENEVMETGHQKLVELLDVSFDHVDVQVGADIEVFLSFSVLRLDCGKLLSDGLCRFQEFKLIRIRVLFTVCEELAFLGLGLNLEISFLKLLLDRVMRRSLTL